MPERSYDTVFPSLWRPAGRRMTRIWLLVFAASAVPILWNVHGSAATEWMEIFRLSDFKSWADFTRFLGDLRVPIPIWLSVCEIAEYRLTGASTVSVDWVYRIALTTSYVMAIRFAAGNARLALWAASILGAIYLAGTRIVHQGNPQSYDVVFPCLLLAYLSLVDDITSGDIARHASAAAVIAGTALSLAELTRPFVALILPFLVLATTSMLRKARPWLAVLFLMPIVVLSGGWHAVQLARHGEILLSNNSGFNLMRGWPMVPQPALVAEMHDAPLGPDRWPNLNTDEHAENSRRLQNAVIAYVISHPGRSIRHALTLLGDFIRIQTKTYDVDPKSAVLPIYRVSAWCALLWLLPQALRLLLGATNGEWTRLVAPQSQVIVIAVASIALLALGESGEQARFVASVLPLLAVFPVYGRRRQSQCERRSHTAAETSGKPRPVEDS